MPKSCILPLLQNLSNRFNSLCGCPNFLAKEDFSLWDKALTPGYGKLGTPGAEALRMMARKEGYILDPVYTAKSFAAIPGILDEKLISTGSRVLYVHTGGSAALFAYQEELHKVLSK